MSENFVNPTYYSLQKATLKFPYAENQEEIDITGLIPSLNIVSSIDSETMYGVIQVIDGVGLLEETPLRGEEQIILEIADSKVINDNGGNDKNAIDNYKFIGFVYKINNVQTKEVNDAIIYDMHFVSYQSFKAATFQIIRAYKDKKVSDIVKELFKEFYAPSTKESADQKSLISEETEGLIRCWIPKMRPEEAMTFLSKRSYSSTPRSPSCLFRFFESSRGYHYVTDEHLFRLAEDKEVEGYDEKRKFNFTYLDAIPNLLSYFDEQRNNLEVINNTHRVNSLDDIYNGVYRNRVIELDILSRQLNLLDKKINHYNYFERRNEYDRRRLTDVEKFEDRHTEKFINEIHRGEQDVQKQWLVVQNYTREELSGDNSMQAGTYYPEIISNRQAYSKHIESITLNAKGPGRLDITAGDIINLSVKKFQFADNRETGNFEQNKHLSGNYIVKSVTHRMDRNEMYNEYVMIKRDWSQIVVDQEGVERNDPLRPGTR
jgi:hypothetical protein